ncbi:GSCFA domain-containing protein [Bacteroidales bacterium OttesenSCG-928-M11]|nr:GSCFA domain-containing protein [Bacteroidales bacterium OttesenSCG-928-M11]
MKFRTEIQIPQGNFSISHKERIMTIGSCFAENISCRMIDAGFRVDSNPFGILYNPISISNALQDLLFRTEFTETDLFEFNGLFQSFSHHGKFSGVNKEKVLHGINKQLQLSSKFIRNTQYLIVTFGTAKAYRLSNGKIVANCHKLPDYYFSHELLSLNDIVQQWHQTIQHLRSFNPKLKILFTVSPIRHWKDGAEENQVSKSILFLAIHELRRWLEDIYYFPAYELMMDDLRDYRFYAEDMLHPSSQAIQYIWEKFGETYFTTETKTLIKEWTAIQRSLNHRPFNEDSIEHKSFLQKTMEKKERFLELHPEFISPQ